MTEDVCWRRRKNGGEGLNHGDPFGAKGKKKREPTFWTKCDIDEVVVTLFTPPQTYPLVVALDNCCYPHSLSNIQGSP